MTGTLLRVICLASAGFSYAAFALSYLKKEKGSKVSFLLWMVGLALNGAVVINNWLVNGYMPFVSMYQVLTFLGVTYGLIYVYVRYAHGGGWMRRYLMISQAVIMTGVFFMAQDAQWTFPPALLTESPLPHWPRKPGSFSAPSAEAEVRPCEFQPRYARS